MLLAQSGTLAADSLAHSMFLAQPVITMPPTVAWALAVKAAPKHSWSEISLRQLPGRLLS